MKNPVIIAFILGFVIFCGTENNPTYQLTTTVSPSVGGTISSSSGTYSEGEVVSLTANPSNGWRFVRWEGDWSGESGAYTRVHLRDGYLEPEAYAKRMAELAA